MSNKIIKGKDLMLFKESDSSGASSSLGSNVIAKFYTNSSCTTPAVVGNAYNTLYLKLFCSLNNSYGYILNSDKSSDKQLVIAPPEPGDDEWYVKFFTDFWGTQVNGDGISSTSDINNKVIKFCYSEDESGLAIDQVEFTKDKVSIVDYNLDTVPSVGVDTVITVSQASGSTTIKSFAYATSHSLSISAETSDISSKDHGLYGANDISKYSWEITSENLYTETDYEDLFNTMIGGEPIKVYFGLKSEEDGTVADGDFDFWTPTDSYLYGNVIITSLQLNANNGENATYSITLSGVGAISWEEEAEEEEEEVQYYGGICVSSTPALPSNSASIKITTSNDNTSYSDSHDMSSVCGKIKIDGTLYDLKMSYNASTVDFEVQSSSSSDFSIAGLHMAGNEITITNNKNHTIQFIDIYS